MTTTPPEFAGVNDKFSAAFVRGDFDGVAATYTRDARLLPPDAAATQGRENIAAFWKIVHDSGIASVDLHTLELTVHGDVAHELGRADLGDGSSTVGTVKYVVIWHHGDDGWRWAVDIWNSGV